jgi:hypothetical protein
VSARRSITTRLTLRRHDGDVYLDRWGVQIKRVGAVFLHRMDAPDPGQDLHDHPWTFISLVLKGGYEEERADTRTWYSALALDRRRFSIRRMRLDECHRVTALARTPTWTLVLCGPVRRQWGFYLPPMLHEMHDGYMDERTYDETVRVHRRDLWEEGGNVEHLIAELEPECNGDPWLGSCPVHGHCTCPSEQAAPYAWNCPLHKTRTRMR